MHAADYHDDEVNDDDNEDDDDLEALPVSIVASSACPATRKKRKSTACKKLQLASC